MLRFSARHTGATLLALFVASLLGPSGARADELPPSLYLWSSGGQTGSFIYDSNAPFNPIFEFTWDQSGVTHSGPAIQYNVTSDITGTQYVFTGGQIGQDFFSIQMQHPDPNLPSVLDAFDFTPPNDVGPGFIGGSFITSSSSSPIDSIINDGFAGLPPNNDPVLTAARINGLDSDLFIDESGDSTNLTINATATDIEAGFLYFTLDGVGPTPAANTGANSLRTSQTINRSVSGDDSNGVPAASYEITVIDPRGAEATITRNVYVQNVAPTITGYTLDGAAANVTVDEGLGFDVIAAMQATDPGADAIAFGIGGQSAGTGGSTPGSTRTANSKTLSFTGQSGSFPIVFTATDDDETSMATRYVTVNNIAPTITSHTLNGAEDDLVVTEGLPFDVIAEMAASDPGPDAINFMIDNFHAGIGDSTPGTTRQSLSLVLPFNGQDGAFPVLFTAQDDEALTDAVRTVTVENVTPTVTGLTLSKTTINEGETITASMTATDLGPDALAFSIHGADAGTGGDTPGSTRSSDTITLGPFLQLTGASDLIDIVASATDDGPVAGELIQTITVLNLPPVIQSITPDGVVAPGEAFVFTATATDLDGVQYSWDTDDDGLYDDASGNNPNNPFKPPLEITPDDVGIYPVHLLVEDGDGGEATATITVISVALEGDYNNDGTVDAADYTVWRDHVGQPFGALVNDPSGLPIGAEQYGAWVANYGQTAAPAGNAVPEPAALILLIPVTFALARGYNRCRC